LINFADFLSYPITLYIYDGTTVGCESEEDFLLTIASSCEFITTWETTTANEQVTIPMLPDGLYNIDWGDGNVTTGGVGDESHTYAAPGDYQVTITGDYPRISFGLNPVSADQIKSIDQWGCNPWTSMNGAFRFCSNLVVNATDTPNLSNVTNLQYMFAFNDSLGGGTGNWDWDTSNITDMRRMFFDADSFNKDISSWDTGNVIDMFGMFQNATNFDQNIGNWNTGNVTSTQKMFEGAHGFNQNIGA
jgi:surface protein